MTNKQLPRRPQIIATKYQPALSKSNVEVHRKLTNGYFDKYPDTHSDFHYGGAVLHSLWWEGITVNSEEDRVVHQSTVLRSFGLSIDSMVDTLTKAASNLQGNGWVYLTKTGSCRVLHNHDVPSNVDEIVLLIDLWEHSMTDYEFDRKKYIEKLVSIINWTVCKKRIDKDDK